MAEFIKLAAHEEPQEERGYVLVDGLEVIASVQTSDASAAFITSGPYPSLAEATTAAKELAKKHGIETLYIRDGR